MGASLSVSTSAKPTPTTAVVGAEPVRFVTRVPSSGPGIRDKTLSERQIAETVFWTVQLKEHCLFIYLGLEPNPTPIESPILQTAAAKPAATSTTVGITGAATGAQGSMVENARLVYKLKLRAQELFMSWSAFEKQVARGVIDVAALGNLVSHTRYLKTRVLDLQTVRGVWVGFLHPEFVEHMREELDYFVQRFNNTIDPDTERLFWDEINGEHLAQTAHALNTDYAATRPVVDQALKLSDESLSQLARLPKSPVDLLQMAELSRRFDHLSYAQRTSAFYADTLKPHNHNLYPVMLAHIQREGLQSIRRLQELALQSQNK